MLPKLGPRKCKTRLSIIIITSIQYIGQVKNVSHTKTEYLNLDREDHVKGPENLRLQNLSLKLHYPGVNLTDFFPCESLKGKFMTNVG